MNYDIHTLILTTIISSLLGGGLGATIVRLLMRNEAKEALKPDLERIDEDIKKIEQNYVSCPVCNATHNSLARTLEDMSHKIDLLLEYMIKNK